MIPEVALGMHCDDNSNINRNNHHHHSSEYTHNHQVTSSNKNKHDTLTQPFVAEAPACLHVQHVKAFG